MLAFLVGDRVLPFPSDSFLLGSGAGCAVRLSQLESRHAEVFFEDNTWQIRDISGTATLRVNGVSTLEAKIDDGSQIRIGQVKLTVRAKQVPVKPDDATFIPQGGSVLANGLVIDGRYQVLGKIAAGGMGAVYLVEHLELSKKFAMKVMLPDLSRDPDFVSRFKREAMASSKIGHQNIVAISDFGRTQDGRFYFVMEYLEGATLAELVRNEGAQTSERVVGIAMQMGRALATAHQAGIIHRDLKPENIMLVQQVGRPDFVKVLDFGVAKVSTAGASEGKTAIGIVIGTPQYMSPEQASGFTVDARSDVYAMGLILYELVTGRPTFRAETPAMMIAKQITEKPAPFDPGPLEDVPELEALVLEMLAKKQDDRPESMDVVLRRLEALPAGRSKSKAEMTRVAPVTAPQPALTMAAPMTMENPINTSANLAMTPLENPTPLPMVTELQPVRPPRPSVTAVSARPEPSVEELAIPKRSKVPIILALVIILMSAGGYGWLNYGQAWLAAQQKPMVVVVPPVVVQPVVKAANAAVTFETTPEGAEVYEGEFLLGVTPFTLQRAKGEIAVLNFVLKGHAPQLRKVKFEDTARVKIELAPTPVAAASEKNVEAPVEKKKTVAPPVEKKAAEEKPAPAPRKEKTKAKKPTPASDELKDLPF